MEKKTNSAAEKLRELLNAIDGMTEAEKDEYRIVLDSLRGGADSGVTDDEMHDYKKATEFYGEKKLMKLCAVFIAFMDYIVSNRTFEVFFSEKKGFYFIAMITDEELESADYRYLESTTIIKDADGFFDYLVTEIIHDVMDLKMNGPHDGCDLAENEIAEIRRRLDPYLNTFIGDSRTHYWQLFESLLEKSVTE